MVQNDTNLIVDDNSQPHIVHIFGLYSGSNCRFSSIGDIVLCEVKDSIQNLKVKKYDIIKTIIVSTKKSI